MIKEYTEILGVKRIFVLILNKNLCRVEKMQGVDLNLEPLELTVT